MANIINNRFENLCYSLSTAADHLTTWFGEPGKKRVSETIQKVDALIAQAKTLNPNLHTLPYYEFHFFENLLQCTAKLNLYREPGQTSAEQMEKLEQGSVQIRALYIEIADIQKGVDQLPKDTLPLKTRLMSCLNKIAEIRPILEDGIYSEGHLNGPYLNSDKLSALRLQYLEMKSQLRNLTFRVMKISDSLKPEILETRRKAEIVMKRKSERKTCCQCFKNGVLRIWNRFPRISIPYFRP